MSGCLRPLLDLLVCLLASCCSWGYRLDSRAELSRGVFAASSKVVCACESELVTASPQRGRDYVMPALLIGWVVGGLIWTDSAEVKHRFTAIFSRFFQQKYWHIILESKFWVRVQQWQLLFGHRGEAHLRPASHRPRQLQMLKTCLLTCQCSTWSPIWPLTSDLRTLLWILLHQINQSSWSALFIDSSVSLGKEHYQTK